MFQKETLLFLGNDSSVFHRFPSNECDKEHCTWGVSASQGAWGTLPWVTLFKSDKVG